MHQPLDVATLQTTFTGKLVAPGDAEYDQLRIVFMGGIDRKPALIVLAENSQDVQAAIALAHIHQLPLAVRSGGHSSLGQCVCDDGIVIDLRKMKAIDLDKEHQTVWAQTGLTAAELTKLLDEHNLALGFGDTGSVGIGGITLNGGIGFLVRQFGMAIDNVLAAEIVTADGQLLQVDADNHPDLFWAVRGGGGNFGVVTRFKYRLHPLTEVVGGMLFLPAEASVIANFMAEASKAPNQLSTIVNIMPAPPMPFLPKEHHGKLIVMAMMLYAGPAVEAEPVLAPFRALTQPLADTLKPMRYHQMFFPDDGSYHPLAVSQTMFMHTVGLPVAETILAQLHASDAAMRAVQLRVLGGAMAQVPPDATAFAHRSNEILVNVATFYQGADDKPRREAWVTETAAKLNQGDNSIYSAFMGTLEAGRIHDAYPGATWEKLVAVKRQYDPENFFKLNQNIDPAG